MNGWTIEAIKAEIAQRGQTMMGLARLWGYRQELVVSASLRSRFPKVNRMVADFIGRTMHELWPAWYDEAGKSIQTDPVDHARYERVLARVAAGEKLLDICSEPKSPSYTAVLAYRRKRPAFETRLKQVLLPRGAPGTSEEKKQRIISALKGGHSIRSQGVVSANTVREIAKRDEDFRRLVFLSYRPSGLRTLGEGLAHREAMTRALRSDEVYALAHRAVPRGLEPFMRDDVVSEVVLGILSGEIRPEDAAKAARRFAASYFGRRNLSMDADLGDGLTLHGSIADGSFDSSGTGIRVRERAW